MELEQQNYLNKTSYYESEFYVAGYAEDINFSSLHPTMEDECIFVENILNDNDSCLLALFDGHGGRETLFPVQLCKDSLSDKKKLNMINYLLQSDPDQRKFQTSGATGTVILIYNYKNERRVHIANIGDSECFLFDFEKIAYPLTYKHKTSDPNEKQRIEKNGGVILNGRVNSMLMITRAFGDFFLSDQGVIVEPFQDDIRLRTGFKYLIVASDGLWDVYLDKDEIGNQLDENKTPQELAQKLVFDAKQRGSRDNISAFVMKFK